MNKKINFAFLKFFIMSRICSISNKKALVGNNVSHSNKKTKRTFSINLIKKKFYIPELKKQVTLKISTSILKTINKKGLSKVIKDYNLNIKNLK